MPGSRGPLGKSRKEKELSGNPGKRPLPPETMKAPPVEEVEELPAPEYLVDLAQVEWRRVVKYFGGLGVISQLDIVCLAAYCESFATWVMAQEQLKKEGLVVTGAAGGPVINPTLRVVDNAKDQLLKFSKELGLTPAARGRINMPGGPVVGSGNGSSDEPTIEGILGLVNGGAA